jgi:alkanesulfonate monooxygenase SsuD/methylene tetrahydromethanopterin reductase-like flavin-dependent oxidoreductase (luciferase family)
MIPLSVLDLVPIRNGASSADAMQEAVDLARLCEALGYTRYWFAEHHGMASIASSVPEILIEHIAAATSRIRVGSGGIMLPNHTPLRVAEAFHTLEALHPGRIDLGIGRAPGTDPATSRALRPFDASQFPEQVREMLALSDRSLPPEHPFATVRVVPSDVPAAADLGAALERRDRPRLPARSVLATASPGTSARRPRDRRYAPIARRSGRPPVRPAARHHRESRSSVAKATRRPSSRRRPPIWRGCGCTGREFLPIPSPEEALAYQYSPQERVRGRDEPPAALHRHATQGGQPDSPDSRSHGGRRNHGDRR